MPTAVEAQDSWLRSGLREESDVSLTATRLTVVVLSVCGSPPAGESLPASAHWELLFEDRFEREDVGPEWEGGASMYLEGGTLRGSGETTIRREFPPDQRLEYTCWVEAGRSQVCDLSAVLCSANGRVESGYFFGFGSEHNVMNKLMRRGTQVGTWPEPLIVPGTKHRVVCQKLGRRIAWWIDGEPVADYTDGSPLTGHYVGLYLFRDGVVDDVAVFGPRGTKRWGGLGADYEARTAVPIEGARAEDIPELKEFLPLSLRREPRAGQPIEQLKWKGRPFFPIGFYGDWGYMAYVPTSPPEMAANGVNCLLSRDVCQRIHPDDVGDDPGRRASFEEREQAIRRALREAKEFGFALIPKLDSEWGGTLPGEERDPRMIEYNVRRLVREPEVWAFSLSDEPDGKTIAMAGLQDQRSRFTDWYTPERARAVREANGWYYTEVKKHAPNHPLLQCLTRSVGISMDAYDIHNTALYPMKRNVSYPFNKLYQGTQWCYETARAIELYGRGTKSFVFSPQSYSRPSKTAPHTGVAAPAEYRYQAFAAVTQGAQGIIYWCLWWATREELVHLFAVTRELNRMAPYILGAWCNGLVTCSSDATTWKPLTRFPLRDPLNLGRLKPLPDVSHCLRREGDEYFLLAVNNTMHRKERVEFTIRTLPGEVTAATDFFTGTQVAVSSGSLAVDMIPYGVNAYVIPSR